MKINESGLAVCGVEPHPVATGVASYLCNPFEGISKVHGAGTPSLARALAMISPLAQISRIPTKT